MCSSRCGIQCDVCKHHLSGKCPGCLVEQNPFGGKCPVNGCWEGRRQRGALGELPPLDGGDQKKQLRE